MAKILKCPRCQGVMDVTSVSPGSTVRCPDCGQMARVPSGATAVAVKTVSAPIHAAAPGAPALRPGSSPRVTKVRERSRSSGTMPNPTAPKSNSGLWVGLGIGGLAVAAVIAVFMMKGQGEEPAPKRVPATPKAPGETVWKPNLPPNPDKPVVLGEGNKSDAKPTVLSKPGETADNVNWDQIMQQLRPGGGFEHDDRPEGVAFKRVKSFGPAAYPKLIKYIDDEDTAIGAAAVSVLIVLTGRESAIPKGITKARIKAEWQAWLDAGGAAPKPDAPKPDAPKQP